MGQRLKMCCTNMQSQHSLEDSEDVESVLDGPLGELVDGVVRVGRVPDSVGSSDERLERNVGHELSERSL